MSLLLQSRAVCSFPFAAASHKLGAIRPCLQLICRSLNNPRAPEGCAPQSPVAHPASGRGRRPGAGCCRAESSSRVIAHILPHPSDTKLIFAFGDFLLARAASMDSTAQELSFQQAPGTRRAGSLLVLRDEADSGHCASGGHVPIQSCVSNTYCI